MRKRDRPRVRVDRDHQLGYWPRKRVVAYRKADTPDQPFKGVREAWILCRIPSFTDDWTIESIDTNLFIYDFVLADGDRRIEVKDAWVDFWSKESRRGKSREELEESAARNGYHPVRP